MVLSRFRLFFFDELCVNTKMAGNYGRALRGERCVPHIPAATGKYLTTIATLGPDGIMNHKNFDGAITG